MTEEEKRDAAIHDLIDLMKNNTFSMEFKVVKKPKGIRIIYEVTKEEMDIIIGMQKEGDWLVQVSEKKWRCIPDAEYQRIKNRL